MDIHSRVDALRATLAPLRRAGKTIALVPTMGNLHAGHIRLMQQARDHADVVVASIFVNRLQFGPNEDFDRYPRTFEADCAQLHEAAVDVLFAPTEADLYPEPQSYVIEPPDIQNLLEGEARPGHFRGVATVVMKLFQIVQPDVALFGKKDYQQLMVLRQMGRQFLLPIKIIGGETVRAADGLALSSRNGYLNAAERTEAPRLYQCLQSIRDAVLAGATNYDALCADAAQTLAAHGWQIDYLSVRRQADLSPAGPTDRDRVIVAAARLGKTRLIDNLEL